MAIISVPPRLNLNTALDFVEELQKVSIFEEVTLDFARLQFVRPFGMLYTAHALKRFSDNNPSFANLSTTNVNASVSAISYAANVGFFRAWTSDHDDLPTYAQGGATYLPISQHLLNSVHTSQHYGREVQTIADNLASKLVSHGDGDLFDVVSYAMREIIRNVAEHSKSPYFWYCAQYLPKSGEIEIAILDTGIGLRTALLENPFIRDSLATDRDALMYALTPGVSGKNYQGVHQQTYNDWQNSGFGLYMVYRLCNEGGSFFICSGNAGFYREKDKEENIHKSVAFQGTALRLCLNTNNLKGLEKRLKTFSADGEALSKEVGKGVVPSPSRISTMLRDNFKERTLSAGDEVRHAQFGNGIVQRVYEQNKVQIAEVSFAGGRTTKVAVDYLRRR